MGRQKFKRPVLEGADLRFLPAKIRSSTAASTALEPRGIWLLETAVTSSGAPVVYTLQTAKPGDFLGMVALDNVSSSQAPFNINAGASACFSYATASTAHNMVALATQGAAFWAIAQNATQWIVLGIRGATFSTST